MASVTGSYNYADGDYVSFTVEVEDSFPSSIWEAKAVCVEAIRDMTGISTADVTFDDGE
jgi:hypothetical protein